MSPWITDNRRPFRPGMRSRTLARALTSLLAMSCGADVPAHDQTTTAPAVTPGSKSDEAPGTAPHDHFVVSAFSLPMTAAARLALGCDFDGDGTTDNQLAYLYEVIGMMRGDPTAAAQASLRRGDGLLLIERSTGSEGPRITTLRGESEEKEGFAPRLAFGGSGRFRRTGEPDVWRGHAGPGGFDLEVAASTAVLPVPLGAGALAIVPVREGRMYFEAEGDDAQGALCALIPESVLREQVLPAWAASLTDAISRGGDQAERLCAMFDLDARCAPSPDECGTRPPLAADGCITAGVLLQHPLLKMVFRPDQKVGDQLALSFGIWFSAVPAVF